ncbi:hypothetical protein IZU99_03195 [Oscillospiraceae bacterium CM]|nr:hypothetical protein IZU99_03195 [Oscillospiraceae bacterium CM]
MQTIMEDEGIELYSNNGKYYLRYDAGELMIKMKNLEISAKEAQDIISNLDTAYNIIITYHDKGVFGEDSYDSEI